MPQLVGRGPFEYRIARPSIFCSPANGRCAAPAENQASAASLSRPNGLQRNTHTWCRPAMRCFCGTLRCPRGWVRAARLLSRPQTLPADAEHPISPKSRHRPRALFFRTTPALWATTGSLSGLVEEPRNGGQASTLRGALAEDVAVGSSLYGDSSRGARRLRFRIRVASQRGQVRNKRAIYRGTISAIRRFRCSRPRSRRLARFLTPRILQRLSSARSDPSRTNINCTANRAGKGAAAEPERPVSAIARSTADSRRPGRFATAFRKTTWDAHHPRPTRAAIAH